MIWTWMGSLISMLGLLALATVASSDSLTAQDALGSKDWTVQTLHSDHSAVTILLSEPAHQLEEGLEPLPIFIR